MLAFKEKFIKNLSINECPKIPNSHIFDEILYSQYV